VPSEWDETAVLQFFLNMGVDAEIVKCFANVKGFRLLKLKKDSFLRRGVPYFIASKIVNELATQEKTRLIFIVEDNDGELLPPKLVKWDLQSRLDRYLLNKSDFLYDANGVAIDALHLLVSGNTYRCPLHEKEHQENLEKQWIE